MARTANADKRTRLIQAAMKLGYRQGWRETSLADIAEEAKVPLGNVYYYFKTKEDIGRTIVDERLLEMKSLHKRLEELASPEERLCAFVRVTFDNRETLARGGCPIGTLCTELHKQSGPLAKQSSALFVELLSWLRAQFEDLGRGADSQGLAVHLLSALQGIAVIAHTLHDPDVVIAETARLQGWIRTLAAKPGKVGNA